MTVATILQHTDRDLLACALRSPLLTECGLPLDNGDNQYH